MILPKPRVTDRVPTELVANPYPRANPGLGMVGRGGRGRTRWTRTKLPSVPKVGVAIPLGFPVGNYATQVRVIENGFFPFFGAVTDDEILAYNGPEPRRTRRTPTRSR